MFTFRDGKGGETAGAPEIWIGPIESDLRGREISNYSDLKFVNWKDIAVNQLFLKGTYNSKIMPDGKKWKIWNILGLHVFSLAP